MDIQDKFNKKKQWVLPRPTGDNASKPSLVKVSQVKFYNEYFATGHKIYDKRWYEDITITDEEGRFLGIHEVNRVSLPIQAMSIDIILAHLLGNDTSLVDASLKENEALPRYKEYWEHKDIDTARYEMFKSVLALGDGALLFYRDKDKGLKWKVLSLFNHDLFHMEYDKYGEPTEFFRYYDEYCDVYDDENVSTYTNKNGTWELIPDGRNAHGFKGIPVVYKKREDGAFWSPVQTNIDNVEKMLSRLSEDNRSKFKSLYHLKTRDPESVQQVSAGMTDMIITEEDGDFKLISPAEISTQFEFEYNNQMELIFQALGLVFPKNKSSGDLPTGSMKMMFYPSERVVMPLIHEFDETLDAINHLVQQGYVSENTKDTSLISNGSIRASIELFTPQDDDSKNQSIATLKREGIISSETASEECTLSANNEIDRLEREREIQITRDKEMADLRLPFTDF